MKNLKLINIIWFQTGWWSLVLLASIDQQELGLVIMALLLLLHFSKISTNKPRDLWLMKSCAALGVGCDLMLMNFEVISWPASKSFPYWLIGLWFLFPLTLPYSFRPFLKNISTLPFLATGAALSYLAGASFQVLEFPFAIFHSAWILTLVWTFYLFAFRFFLETVERKTLIKPTQSACIKSSKA